MANLLTIIGGHSGTGKSSSMANLGTETVVLNTERKELPFRNKNILNIPIGSTEKMNEALARLSKNEDYRIIVIDSFSEYIDMLMQECKSKAKGFDIYSLYNTGIYNFFQTLKSLRNKYVFVIGHTEVLQDADGDRIQRLHVHGKANEGMIEKNATCVFFAKTVKRDDGKGVEYRFMTNTDGESPSKTPRGMYGELYIDNDIKSIVMCYDAFYEMENPVFLPDGTLSRKTPPAKQEADPGDN